MFHPGLCAVKRMGPGTRGDDEPLRVPRCRSEKQEGDQREEKRGQGSQTRSRRVPLGLGS